MGTGMGISHDYRVAGPDKTLLWKQGVTDAVFSDIEEILDIAMQIAATDGEIVDSGPDELLKQDYIKDPSKTVGDLVQDAVQKFGERTEIGRITKFVI